MNAAAADPPTRTSDSRALSTETAAEATSATLPAATNSPATSYRAAATSAAWLDPVRRARAWRPATCSTLPGTYLAIWLRAYKLWLVRAATPR